MVQEKLMMEINNELQQHFFETSQCLIVSITFELYQDMLQELQKMLLIRVQKGDMRGVIIDISSLTIIDDSNLHSLVKLSKTIKIMGKECVIVGFQPGAASALAEIPDIFPIELITAISIETAINYLLTKDKRSVKVL